MKTSALGMPYEPSQTDSVPPGSLGPSLKRSSALGREKDEWKTCVAHSGRRRHVVRTFAIFSAILLALLALFPWVETQGFPAGPAIQNGSLGNADVIGGASDSAAPPEGGSDSPGGPSPPPGSVTSAYAAPPPVQSTLPATAFAPSLTESATSYRYETVVGVFEFSKATPYLVRYELASGDPLVIASTFVVSDPTILPFVDPTVLNATDYRFQVRYDLLSGAT